MSKMLETSLLLIILEMFNFCKNFKVQPKHLFLYAHIVTIERKTNIVDLKRKYFLEYEESQKLEEEGSRLYT